MSHFKERIDLFRSRAFSCFMVSVLFSAFGNGLTYIVMAWLVQQNDKVHSPNSVIPVTVLMICFWLPSTLLGPFMGVFVDRHPRKLIIIIANAIRALVWAGFGLLFYYHMSNELIYLLAVISGLLLSLYWPAATAFIREVVEEKKLLYANSLVDITYEGGNVIGMGCAGVIMAMTSDQAAIWLNGICYAVATACVLLIKKVPFAKATNLLKKSVINELVLGLQYLVSNKNILSMYTLQLLVFVQLMTTPILIVPYATAILHTNVREFGQIEAAMSVGIVVGGIIIPWLAERLSFTQFLNGVFVLAAVAFIWFSHNQSIAIAIFIYFILGLCFSIWSLVVTHAQNITELDYQGRVQAAFNSLSGVMILIVYLLVNLSSHLLSLTSLYYVEVALSIAGIILVSLSAKMHLKLEI